MGIWRFGRGWPEAALRAYLAELAGRTANFDLPPQMMTPEHGWIVDGAHSMPVGSEAPGPPEPGGFFERAKQALINYDFSDPRIVVGHFDPETDFVGRDILLEFRVLGFHFLNGCRVHSVREESGAGATLFGFRYDTLQGHIEQGFEWFLLSKEHATGHVHFSIEAHWRLGDFPNWWTRLGFRLIGGHYRTLWRHRAPERLRRLAHQYVVSAPVAAPGELAHRGDPEPRRTTPSESSK